MVISRARKRIKFVGHKYSSLSVNLSFNKKKKQSEFKSELETDFAYLLEFDNEVSGFLEHPFDIMYQEGKKQKTYSPSFLIQYHDKTRKDEIVEILDSTENKTSLINQEKFKAVKLFCNQNQLKFCFLSERDIRSNHAYLENVKFLSGFRNYYENLPRHIITESNQLHFEILDTLDAKGMTTIKSVINQIENNKASKEELLFKIWYLISNNFILCDLNSKLDLESLIWTDYD